MTRTGLPTPDTAAAGVPVRVSEVFGPTLQGEGPSCGRSAMFVRLMLCTLACPTCDTPYTWDRSRFDLDAETTQTDTAAVLAEVLARDTGLVVITGGEPLLQAAAVTALALGAVDAERVVEIETNGTLVPPPELLAAGVFFNVSPKLSSFGAPDARRISGDALRVFGSYDRSRFKFVASGPDNLDEVAELVAEFALAPVWIMPEGATDDQATARLRTLADPVVARGWNLTPRLHLTLWGGDRGR